MPLRHDKAQLTIFRNGQARFNDLARRYLLGKSAVALAAPTTIGSRWLVLPLEAATEGAQPLYDDRGQRRFGAYALAAALFAVLPARQKSVSLALQEAPVGFWLVPAVESGEKHENLSVLAEAA